MTSTPPPKDLHDLARRLGELPDDDTAAAGHGDGRGSSGVDSSPSSAPTGTRRSRRTALMAIIAGAIIAIGGVGVAIAVTQGQSPAADSQDATGGDEDASESQAESDPGDDSASPESPSAEDPETSPDDQQSAAASAEIDDPNSITVVVNKLRPLAPVDWAPSDLAYPEIPNANGQPMRYEAAVALETMYAEANAAGVPFAVQSGYRSYALQDQLFGDYAAGYGVESAETFSARAGHSEHQTGLAVDISTCVSCPLSYDFGSTPQGRWAAENAYRFGFILRYPEGSQPIVGYVYEPWHFRYVGPDVAQEMHDRGIATLEEYFGLAAAPTY